MLAPQLCGFTNVLIAKFVAKLLHTGNKIEPVKTSPFQQTLRWFIPVCINGSMHVGADTKTAATPTVWKPCSAPADGDCLFDAVIRSAGQIN